ncbi:hypothetical protein BT96DRAFT_59807 [Gymnopus androsaceus JB14]|uniref:Uncharacterized protein n=1 Tax=Gymnopus androsaceus JB14 TaxID=1447944 RepID=A0A6A4IBK6_9AGAR|nr:hypothetical protein BT96DRAFT_59807 [Gymnopus androsaceus JB14]
MTGRWFDEARSLLLLASWPNRRASGWTIEDPEAGEEELLKQREHRSKATKVLALLQLEQEALEKEEQEEKERQEKVLEEEQESVRRAHLQLETLAAEMDGDEEEEEEPIEWDRETISSEIWAWTHVEDNGRCYREDMHALVTKFEEANRKVWREVIHRHQPSRSPGSSPSSAQLRGGKYDILRLQSKRQHQLKECIEVQNHWHIMRALQTHNQDH